LILFLTSENISGLLSSMNEKIIQIRLRDFMQRDDGWGHEDGKRVLDEIMRFLGVHSHSEIVRISIDGVRMTDASFPRESVVELARRYRLEKKGVSLTNFFDEDLLDNWDAAALKKEQPLLVWNDDQYRIIGPLPSVGNKEIFELAMSHQSITASAAAKALDLKIANASMKLRQLEMQGYLLRKEVVSPSGGIEFVYFRIK